MKNSRKNSQNNAHVISFRVSAEEREVLLRQAKKSGVNLSLLIRKKLDMPVQNVGLEASARREGRGL